MRTQHSCKQCGGPVSRTSASGMCRVCARRARGRVPAPQRGNCGECGKQLGLCNKTGYCAVCGTRRMNADPVFQASRVAGVKRKWQDPEYAAKMRKIAQRLGRVSALDEELQERRRKHGKRVYAALLCRPDVMARSLASRKAMGPKIRAMRMAWCPPELWDKHKHLVRCKKMKTAEAREIVLKEWDEIRAARHECFESVVHFMRRLTAVIDRGPHEEKRYRVGLADMTPGELLRRAEAKGYQEFEVAA